MPNFCINYIHIKGPKDKIKKIWDEAQKEGKGLLSAVAPKPEALEDTTFDNWYDWTIANWGTNWEADL